MQDNVTLTLTRAEFKVLLDHFRTDFEWGANGSFGNGENLEYWDSSKDRFVKGTKEYKIAERVVKKLEKEL